MMRQPDIVSAQDGSQGDDDEERNPILLIDGDLEVSDSVRGQLLVFPPTSDLPGPMAGKLPPLSQIDDEASLFGHAHDVLTTSDPLPCWSVGSALNPGLLAKILEALASAGYVVSLVRGYESTPISFQLMALPVRNVFPEELEEFISRLESLQAMAAHDARLLATPEELPGDVVISTDEQSPAYDDLEEQ